MNERELEVVIRAVDWVLADQSDLEFAGFTELDRAHAYNARDALAAELKSKRREQARKEAP